MKPVEITILIIFLVLAVLIYFLPLAAGLCMERKDRKTRGEPDPEKAKYDERQRLIRLEAGTHAMYAAMIYLAAWFALEVFGLLDTWPDRNPALLGCGMLLPMLVWNSECILRDAHLGFNQGKNETNQILVYLIIGACWTMIGAINQDVSSMRALSAAQLLLGTGYVLQGVLMLIARRRRRLAERNLDAEDGER